jgi:methylthioribose-1-phosphate isomerase
MIKTIEWTDQGVRMIDQTKLPMVEEYPVFRTADEVAEAIRLMVIRGAPAIGVAAAMGIALGMKNSTASTLEEAIPEFEAISDTIGSTRPTAVNLFWAIDRMKRRFEGLVADGVSMDVLRQQLIDEALGIQQEDIDANMRMGRFGQELMPPGGTVLTHCNAGALATAGYGTALGVIRAAVAGGNRIRVLADETRPFLQGARLTAWELWKDNIDVHVIADNMAGAFMRQGIIDAVIVGADRIAGNGDVANKIGTYTVAVLAKHHDIPFFVAAPVTTLDLTLESGSDIPIEDRDPAEVTSFGGIRTVPEAVSAFNPAFDVTPHEFVTAIITDHGVARSPYRETLPHIAKSGLSNATKSV